jgi:hypothetical protein
VGRVTIEIFKRLPRLLDVLKEWWWDNMHDSWYWKNPKNRELTIQRSAARALAKPEAVRGYKRKYRLADPERHNASNRASRKRDPLYNEKRRGTRKEESRKRYFKFKPQLDAQSRAWALANPEGRRAIARRSIAKSRLDPAFIILQSQRSRVRWALSSQQTRKSAQTIEYVGCSAKFLAWHMEVQFRDGMTWKNYGSRWHVDHILPCASFDLSNHEQQKKCFHWTNLQPLLAAENLAKGAK